MTTEPERHEYAEVRTWQLWFSLAAGIVAWALHLMIVYPITSLTCEWGWFPSTILGLSGLKFVQLVVTIVAALLVGFALVLALNNWRSLRAAVPDDQPEAARVPFMAYMGVLLNIVFLASILLAIVPILVLEPCGVV